MELSRKEAWGCQGLPFLRGVVRKGLTGGTALLGPWPQLSLFLDLDECAFPGVCPTGVCTNTVGSFSCKDCDKGYRPSPLGNSCVGKSTRGLQ